MAKRFSSRGGREVLPLILILFVLGTPLSAAGNGESEGGFNPKEELEKASALIEEGRLDDAIEILVDLARNDPEQMERVQKLILDIRDVENEISGLFDQVQEIIESEELEPDEKLVRIEDLISQIKIKDSDPTSDTWMNLSFVESGLRRSLDELRRVDFFDRGNEKLALELYRDAVNEYRKGFIDDSFGERQTYEKYRDAQTSSDIDTYSYVPVRQQTILDAYSRHAPTGDGIIEDIESELDFWDQNSVDLSDTSSGSTEIISLADPQDWADELELFIDALIVVDEGVQSVRILGDELDSTRIQLYESLNGSPEDYRYDRIGAFLNGRAGNESEGILFAQELQWEDAAYSALSAMTEKVVSPYEEGRVLYRSGLWDDSNASLLLSENTVGFALDFAAVAENHMLSHQNRGITRFTDTYGSLLMLLQVVVEASEIRLDLNEISRNQPETDNVSLSQLNLSQIQDLADELQISINLIEELLTDWDVTMSVLDSGTVFNNPDIRKVDIDLRTDLQGVLDDLYGLRVNVFILYMEPRYNLIESEVSTVLEDNPVKRAAALALIESIRPSAALTSEIEPALSAVALLEENIDDFLETVDDVLDDTPEGDDRERFMEYRTKADALKSRIGTGSDELQEIRSDALNRRNTALRAETIALAGINEAVDLIQSARTADLEGRNTNNINESYRAQDLYISAGAALDRAGDLLLQIELNDVDVAAESGISERIAELKAEALNAPRTLAVTVRDYAIVEAGRAFNERRYDEGLSVVSLAQDFWVNIWGEEDTRLREWKNTFDEVRRSAQNTRIEPSDPLYMEMNQYLNLANRYYNEGVRLSPSGTSNTRNADATRAFSASENLLQQVLNVFPGNAAALLLKMKVLEATEPNEFGRIVTGLISEADAALRRNDRAAIEGTDFEQGLDPQIQAVYSFRPDFPGLAEIVNRIDIYLGRIIPPPDPADIRLSQQITGDVSSDWELTKPLGVLAVTAASPALIRRLDEALVLWDGNVEAAGLQDEIRFYTEPPALPENLRRLLNVAEDQKLQNNRSSVETIYRSIEDNYPSFLSHPDVLKLKNWLGIQ